MPDIVCVIKKLFVPHSFFRNFAEICRRTDRAITISKSPAVLCDDNSKEMNVKFKMPKFGRKLTGGGMVKELLLTTLATTISIVLTFGTARLIEHRQAQQAQRQTAMMLIHDIDASVAILEHLAESEERQKSAIQYVIDHFDQIDSLPEDTLYTALSMLGTIYHDDTYFDDSKEKIFSSSQDTWKNLSDVPFVDNMETFYQTRRYLENLISRSPQWKFPISEEEYFEMVVQNNANGLSGGILSAVLKEKLKDQKIRFYIDCSTYRARTLRQYAQTWKRLSDRNKFIMNIDDEELAEFVKKSQRVGRTVSNSDIIGQWEYEISGKDIYYYNFMKPDSFSIESRAHYANPFYSGDIIVTYTFGGKWKIKGDSLALNYSPESVKAQVDRSGITYRDEMRDSVEAFFDRYFQVNQLVEMGRKQTESKKDTFAVSINKANDKIEFVRGRSEDSENENANFFYLKRSNRRQ